MFTFVIGLVVVGAALAIAARVVMGEAPQPATGRAARDRDRGGSRQAHPTTAPGTEVAERPPWWARLRSGILLALLLTIVGAFVALLVVLAGALVLTAIRTAVQ